MVITKPVMLTVMLQAHNFEKYIAQCLDSILAQKVNFDYEILACDDCASDRSLEILREYEKKFPQIVKVVTNDTNLGCAKTAYKLHSISQGKYLTMIDGDDYLTDENRFQEQVNFLEERSDYAAVAGNTVLKYEDGNRPDELIVNSQVPETYEVEDFIMARSYFHTSAIMYRNVYKGKVPLFLKHEYGRGDWLRTIIHASHGKVGYINKLVSVYRVHEKGIWNTMNDFGKFRRNTNACLHFNRFLNYKYNKIFCERIFLFVKSILLNHKSEISKISNLGFRFKCLWLLLKCRISKKMNYRIKI